MSAVVGVPGDGGVALQERTTEELYADLNRALEVTAGHLRRLAEIWRELERRGQDLSGLRSGLWAFMPLIASGKLRAEVVVSFAGNATLLRRMADLPQAEQDRLAAEGTVQVAVREGSVVQAKWMRLTHLSARQISQVFQASRVVPVSEQVVREGRTPRNGPDTIEAIAQAVPLRRTNGAAMVVMGGLSFSPREMSQLKDRAEKAGVSVQKLVRAAVIKAGLFEE